ncbi:MAG: bifunctional diguanylate cyclase/phosphohydrolase [Saccharofermentanales bacterium]
MKDDLVIQSENNKTKNIENVKRAAGLLVLNKKLTSRTKEKDEKASDLITELLKDNMNLIAETEVKEQQEKELIKKLDIQSKYNFFYNDHDILTGLYNRKYFEKVIQKYDNMRNVALSVIIGDINGLKLINDSFGYEIGDKTIIEVSNIIKDCCRRSDIISRTGGDEFCIILPKADEEITQKICKRIYSKCESKQNKTTGRKSFISVSLGYDTRGVLQEPISDIMKEAEERMYKHKLLESRSLRSSIVSSVISTLQERYIETDEHGERMKKLSCELGTALNISDSMQDDLELLAILHDIGKIAIKDTIINKNSKLTLNEMNEIQTHSEIGYRITQSTVEFQQISKYILAHHERWDGTGYPNKLKKEEIPLLSRIISVVDAYDAMTNDRPYCEKLTVDNAIKEIKECSGTQFDPEIAKVFIEKVIGKEW